jgi:hypothetical protein
MKIKDPNISTRIISINAPKALFLLFSIDVIDSTAKKYELAQENKGGWLSKIREFYKQFPSLFNIKAGKPINIWKLVGDEILFYVRIEDIKNEAGKIIKGFRDAICEWNSDDNGTKLFVKGCIWTAQVQSPDAFIGISYKDKNGTTEFVDFLGESVDCGFRIAKVAEEDKIAISLEVAYLCLFDNELKDFVYYQGLYDLKGVFDKEHKYPIFYLNPCKDNQYFDKSINPPCKADKLETFISIYYAEMDKSEYKNSINKISQFLLNFGNLSSISFVKSDKAHATNENNRTIIDEMKEWFLSEYEDPAENCPYESREDGYLFIGDGKSHEAEEELFIKYGKIKKYNKYIKLAAKELQDENGIYEWNKK